MSLVAGAKISLPTGVYEVSLDDGYGDGQTPATKPDVQRLSLVQLTVDAKGGTRKSVSVALPAPLPRYFQGYVLARYAKEARQTNLDFLKNILDDGLKSGVNRDQPGQKNFRVPLFSLNDWRYPARVRLNLSRTGGAQMMLEKDDDFLAYVTVATKTTAFLLKPFSGTDVAPLFSKVQPVSEWSSPEAARSAAFAMADAFLPANTEALWKEIPENRAVFEAAYQKLITTKWYRGAVNEADNKGDYATAVSGTLKSVSSEGKMVIKAQDDDTDYEITLSRLEDGKWDFQEVSYSRNREPRTQLRKLSGLAVQAQEGS